MTAKTTLTQMGFALARTGYLCSSLYVIRKPFSGSSMQRIYSYVWMTALLPNYALVIRTHNPVSHWILRRNVDSNKHRTGTSFPGETIIVTMK